MRKLNKEKIGKKLAELRGNKSREEVARDIGISLSAWQMYENGQRIPRDEIKIKIASYFNKSVEEIFYS
ncbi:helix-turn-helix transcriptional regulator [Ureibacillus terrenus]|uniref:helix-turn-helix transcriptional regulator n=1 Tax=Ureibacillus terrenus TaxID=118246 RepID=UPI0038B41FD0